MLRLRPYNVNDVDKVLSWSRDERAFYKWSAGILGEYPITKEQFIELKIFVYKRVLGSSNKWKMCRTFSLLVTV